MAPDLSEAAYERTTCRLCGSAKLESRLKLKSTPPANSFAASVDEATVKLRAFGLEVMQCKACSHHQLRNAVPASQLFLNYLYVSGTSPTFRAHFDGLAKAMKIAGARRVVEVGSNDGTLMKALQKEDVTVVGVEYAENLVSQCKGEGLEVLGGGATVANFETCAELLSPGADFWVACNVLAHIDDFGGVLRALHHTGAKHGVFEVQYLHDLLKKGTFDMVYHEHVDYWRARELIDELHKYTGWWVTKVEHINTHGGSLRVWVSDGQAFIGTGMSNITLEEEVEDTTRAFQRLEDKIGRCKVELLSAIAGKETIAAYGAPAKFTTFTSALGLDTFIDYVVDDSPLKQGKFTPGSGIPVVTYRHLHENPPDIILITAWNFADDIATKLRADKKLSSIPLVVPFPEVKVL